MPWYLHLALRQLFPTGRWFPFFTMISALGVALGVALLVIVMSVMSGFAHGIRHLIVDTEGEVQVVARGSIADYPSLVRKIESVPGVKAATPYARDAVMIKFGDKPAFPMLRGLDLGSVERVTQLGRYVVSGSLDDLDDDSVILSIQLAASIGAAATVSAPPAAIPTPARISPRRSTSHSTSQRVAPTATRMPNSCSRRLTV